MPAHATRRLLEINDVALMVADAGGTLTTSPGQIICGETRREGLLVGRAASERRRINPRATHDRFWSILDQTPLPYPAGPARSNADLVWLHLRELLASLDRRDRESWTVVVPAAYDDEQLALLLGIARSLELEIDRLVSAPVAAAAAAASGMTSMVVDAHWHRFSADLVDMSDGTYRLDPDAAFDGRTPGGRGLGALFDAWAALVNDAFVAQTRFDPSHDAVIEQRLYNHLPDWLARMARGEDVAAELDIGEHRYRAELSSQAFIAAADPFYKGLTDRIRQADAGALVLRHRLQGLPGLVQSMAQAGFEATCWLEEHDVARTALSLPAAEPDNDGTVVLTVHWGVDKQAPHAPAARRESTPEQAAGQDVPVPSHVLVDGRALAIDSTGRALSEHWRMERGADGSLALVGNPDDPAAEPASINGLPAGERNELKSGDRVSIGSTTDGKTGNREYVLLRVEDSG